MPACMQHTLFDWEQWLAGAATPSRRNESECVKYRTGVAIESLAEERGRVSAEGGARGLPMTSRHSDSIVVQSDDKSSGHRQLRLKTPRKRW
jgi:hypothetical protein